MFLPLFFPPSVIQGLPQAKKAVKKSSTHTGPYLGFSPINLQKWTIRVWEILVCTVCHLLLFYSRQLTHTHTSCLISPAWLWYDLWFQLHASPICHDFLILCHAIYFSVISIPSKLLLPNQLICLREMQTGSQYVSYLVLSYSQIFIIELNRIYPRKKRMWGESDSKYWASRKLSRWDNKSKEERYKTSIFIVLYVFKTFTDTGGCAVLWEYVQIRFTSQGEKGALLT